MNGSEQLPKLLQTVNSARTGSPNFKIEFDNWLMIYREALYNSKPWRVSSEGLAPDSPFSYPNGFCLFSIIRFPLSFLSFYPECAD
jgi:hypothetical protein